MENPAQSGTAVLPDQEQKIMMYVQNNGYCTTASIAKLLHVKERRARDLIGNLVKKSILTKEGNARNTRYVVGKVFSGKE